MLALGKAAVLASMILGSCLNPLAAQEAQLHHFVAAGVWKEAPLETELLIQADKLVGGSDAALVIDDTSMPKKGKHSVGVAAQYASALGKTANCQTLVSLTLARGEVPVTGSAAPFPPGELDERSSTFEAGWRSGRTSNGTDEAGDSARRDRSHDRSRCPLRLCAGRCRLRAERAIPVGDGAQSGLGRWYPASPQGVPCRRAAHLAHCRARPSSSAARPEHSIDGSRRYAR